MPEYRIVETGITTKYELQQKYTYREGKRIITNWVKCCRGTLEDCNNVLRRKVG